jgi:hypothetical protein
MIGKYLIFGERVMISTFIPEIEHELLRAGKIKWKLNNYFAVHVAQQDLPHVLIWCSQFFQNFEWTETFYKKLIESKVTTDSLRELNVKSMLDLAANNDRFDLFEQYPDSVLIEHARPWDVLSFSLRWKRWSLASLVIEKMAKEKELDSDTDDETDITGGKEELNPQHQKNMDDWTESTPQGQFFHQFYLAFLHKLEKDLSFLAVHGVENDCSKFLLKHLQYFENLSPIHVALTTIFGNNARTRLLAIIMYHLAHQNKLEWILQLKDDYPLLWKYSCIRTIFNGAQSQGNRIIMDWAYEQGYRSMDAESISNPVALQWMLAHKVDVTPHYGEIVENAFARGDDVMLKALSASAWYLINIKEATIQKLIQQGKTDIFRLLLGKFSLLFDKVFMSKYQWARSFPNILQFVCQPSIDSVAFLEILHELDFLHVERAYQEAVLNANFYVLNWLYARFGRWTQQHMSYYTADRNLWFPVNKIKRQSRLEVQTHLLHIGNNLFRLALYLNPRPKMIKMLNWLRDHAAPEPFCEHPDGTRDDGYHQCWGLAVIMGKICALKWALSSQNILKHQIYCELAVRAGDLQTLVWLLGHKFPIDVELCQSICQQDHIRHLGRYKTINMFLKNLDPKTLEKLHAEVRNWGCGHGSHIAFHIRNGEIFCLGGPADVVSADR